MALQKHRVIFHLDMNSFYASVEAALDKDLMGKPLAIAGNSKKRRGIVVTASYEARAQGVKPPMPLWEAMKHCPSLIVREPNFTRYRAASEQIFERLYDYTPLVEPVSIDEGYMDVTDCLKEYTALELAQHIQRRLKEELNLPCSIGIAPNKFLAKMASDMKKPMGITILRKREVEKLLWPLDVIEMHGIGGKTAEKLNRIGVKTVKDIALSDPQDLENKFGVSGRRMYEKAYGNDSRPVNPESIHDFKSIGNSTTLPEDTTDNNEVRKVLMNLSDKVSSRLRNKDVYAENIQLTIKYHNFQSVTRSQKLKFAIDSHELVVEAAWQLWTKYWNGEPVRLLGVTAMDLVEKGKAYKQLDLFSYEKDKKEYQIDHLVDSIRKKYGEKSLIKGGQIQKRKPNN